jgi:putative transcriptional regulator
MGVPFADRESLENTASAIGSNMFEGFVPTPYLVELLRDFVEGKLSRAAFNSLVKERS